MVSLPIFADFARTIAGDQAVVTTLIPAGADPHTYVPSEDLGQAVAEANAIFYNGLDLEAPTQRFIEQNLADRPPYVVDFVRNVPSPSTQQPVDRPIYAKDVGDDPHLFLDPVLVPVYPETIQDTMTILDGANASYYHARYKKYQAELFELNDYVTDKLKDTAPNNRLLLVTYHNSLIHFANRYGLGVAGTLRDDGEDGLSQVLTDRRPPALFTEAGFDATVLTQMADQAGISTCELYKDNVPDDSMSYIDMIEYDADTLADCLG